MAVILDSARGAIKLDNQWSNIEFSLFAGPGESKQKHQAQHEAMIQSLKEGTAEQIQVVVDTRKLGFLWLFPGALLTPPLALFYTPIAVIFGPLPLLRPCQTLTQFKPCKASWLVVRACSGVLTWMIALLSDASARCTPNFLW